MIAFVSQSGALVTAVLDWAKSRHIGFSHMVSLGERADVDFGDLLDYLASDARTRSILLYIESIKAPRKFMSAARAAARNKPVIVVKAGRAGNGVKAAASHTGALAGSDVVFDAAIRRAGMLRVDTLQDLFMAAETLARFRGDRDERADPDDQRRRRRRDGRRRRGAGRHRAARAGRRRCAPGSTRCCRRPGRARTRSTSSATRRCSATPRRCRRCSPTATPARCCSCMRRRRSCAATTSRARCAPIARQAAARIMACWLGDAAVAEARRIFEDAGVADYATPEEAVHAFAMLATYRRNQALLAEAPTASENGPPDLAAARAVIDAALADGRDMLDEFEAKAVLRPTASRRCRPRAVDARPRRRWPRRANRLSGGAEDPARPTSATSRTSAACASRCATTPSCARRRGDAGAGARGAAAGAPGRLHGAVDGACARSPRS